MIREYVKKTQELIELSKGIIRFVIQQEPITLTDMAGNHRMESPEVRLILNYTALSIANDPQRIISLKIDFGICNSYDKDAMKERFELILNSATKEVTQYLDDSSDCPAYRDRIVSEGGFA